MSEPTMLAEDAAFERLLLGAGQADALPHDQTQAALERFTASLTALQGAGAVTATVATANLRRRGWLRFLAPAKWIALGALAGTVATLVWLRPIPQRLSGTTVVETVRAADALPPAVAQASSAAPSLPPASTEAPPSNGAKRSHVLRAAPHPVALAGSDLAAEVTALDGVRTALSIGALSDAERQLAGYRRRFVRGALRSEAEVLALELLLAQGRTQAAGRAADRFISEHPRDPQVARVRDLTQ